MNYAQPATMKSYWRTSHGRRVRVVILGVSDICYYLVHRGLLFQRVHSSLFGHFFHFINFDGQNLHRLQP